ncbi:hypothetical protein [Streptomyces sulphureus]|uniref:hypothetical protein n=1 Tax=Streptomyces sulphureus TaxID=47758 RepID=UPI00037AE135|nr:hypothetical protein [Streptomyces sulphureus]
MRRLALVVGLVLVVLAPVGYALFHREGPRPPVPLPEGVPRAPSYDSAPAVVARLDARGIPCKELPRDSRGQRLGQLVACEATVDGREVGLDIYVAARRGFDRDRDLGTMVANSRARPYFHTLVVAGNWKVRVHRARFASDIAEALGGVVLRPFGTPHRELPPA